MKLLLAFSFCGTVATAFLLPRPLLASQSTLDIPHQLHDFPIECYETYVASSRTLLSMEPLKQLTGRLLPNVLLGVAIIVLLFAGAKLLYSFFILPEAAEQLESETKELAPKIWKDVNQKFEDGEKLEERPDLMQELFLRIRPYLDRELALKRKMESESENDVTHINVNSEVDIDMPEKDIGDDA